MNRSLVYLRVNRVDAETCNLAQAVTVSDLHEAEYADGRSGLMSGRMKPVTPGMSISGPAVTAYCPPGDNLMMHRALYLAQPGDVLIVVCEAETSGAQWGDMAARYAMRKGLAGVVVQGCVRDTDTVRALGCPVWSTHVRAVHPDKSGHGRVNAPLICDGVQVCPGDLIVADGDGVVCVPRRHAAASVARALARMRSEDAMAQAVAAGASVWELSGAAARYAAMSIKEIDAACDDPPNLSA
ncbi:RraA family protein [Bordetella sp. 2513F-2]